MIHTITLNPSVDYYIYLDRLNPGINRSKATELVPGGKGINVSIVLNNLSTASEAHYFRGGFTGGFIAEMLKRFSLIRPKETDIAGITRINVKIRTDSETDLNALGPEISEEERKRMIDSLEDVSKGDFVVVSGSCPVGINGDFIRRIVEICRDKGAGLILDVPDMDLETICQCRPHLIKPNSDELEKLLNSSVSERMQIVEQAEELIKGGVERVLVSLGEKGALYVSAKKRLLVSHPVMEAVNTVGAGDSMLAGFVYGLEKGKSEEKALKIAAAAALATVSTGRLAEEPAVKRFIESIRVERI